MEAFNHIFYINGVDKGKKKISVVGVYFEFTSLEFFMKLFVGSFTFVLGNSFNDVTLMLLYCCFGGLWIL